MTSIFFLKETIYCYIFRWNYLGNRKYFLNLFLRFLNLDSILNIFIKKMALIADVFLNLRAPENVFGKVSKRTLLSVSEDPSKSNIIKEPKHCSKLDDSTFTIFIYTWEHHWGLKSLSELYSKSSYCLLPHSLPIISILFLTKEICWNISRWNYLRNKRLFVNFFFSIF